MPDLKKILAALKKHYGEPALPPARGPFELVLWENAVYLMPDSRRAVVFECLRTQVGLTAKAISKASHEVLSVLAQLGGMRPETRVLRWREIARITLDQYGGDLDHVLDEPYAEAKKVLKQFPTIGDPGAEKILMYCGVASGLPLESNGLRVLTRIGFGRAQKNYGAAYKSVQDAIQLDLPRGAAPLARAHLLLREHGKTICKNNVPQCAKCPIEQMCSYPAKSNR